MAGVILCSRILSSSSKHNGSQCGKGSQAQRKFSVFVINWGTVKPLGHIRQGEERAAPPCNSGLDVCFAGKTSKELVMLHTTLHFPHASMGFSQGWLAL